MPRFSITLPSIRPSHLDLALDAIRRASGNHDYEIVVVSPFKASGEHVKHVPEDAPMGNCPAHAAAYRASDGEFVVAMSDDHAPAPGWLDGLAERIRDAEARHFPFAAGLARPNYPRFGTVYAMYYPYFPVASRESLERAGGFFSPEFTAHFGDPDLGFRIWHEGGRCELFPEHKVWTLWELDNQEPSPHKNAAREADMARFREKWGGVYGRHFGHAVLFEMNMDHPVDYLPQGGTFMANLAWLEAHPDQARQLALEFKGKTGIILSLATRGLAKMAERAKALGMPEKEAVLQNELQDLRMKLKAIFK